MWFSKLAGDTHKEHIECFYGPQAHACKLCFVMLLWSSKLMYVICTFLSLVFWGFRGLGFRTATFALVEILCTYAVQNFFFIYLFIFSIDGRAGMPGFVSDD